ncbi:protein boule-like isoform X2 [Thrips palmi]|uniref:Protein boule-like isoform X2 n=1 Tax=Thrips palmi TaxID=161013 RepID=A0A6P8ZQ60_THRPL|nr:protein boule-like isoform X2 [Thrips palmi]
MNCLQYFPDPLKTLINMTSFYNGVPHSSSVSEISSAPPSPLSCNTSSPGNAPRYGVVVPNRVFVGGIAANTTETELQELFSQYGSIKEIKIISDRGGVCKGYGFVTFETEEEAKKVQHQPDTIVLKERRLNIAPAVMKQQPFGRPYDPAPPTGALVYHNGTTYTYQNGMAFFTATNSTQAPYSIGASRETSMYAAPYGPSQTSAPAAYPQIMYPYTQPMPYLTPGQQYQYQLPFDYFKAVGPATTPYIYAQPSPLNGAINSALNGGLGNSSQSPSPGYGQSGMAGPTGGEIYYNGATHPAQMPLQPQPMYSMESSPAHSEVAPVYSSSGRPLQQQQYQPYHQQSAGYPRRGGGGNSMRNAGPKIYTGNSKNLHHNSSGNYNAVSNQFVGNAQNTGQHQAPANVPKNSGESVNGMKTAAEPANGSSSTQIQKQEITTVHDGGAGDASTIRHTLPISPPNTPLPQESSAAAAAVTAAGDGDMCQKMKTLAL